MKFKEAEESVYLGLRITCKCQEEKEIEVRLNNANNSAERLNNRLLRTRHLSISTN